MSVLSFRNMVSDLMAVEHTCGGQFGTMKPHECGRKFEVCLISMFYCFELVDHVVTELPEPRFGHLPKHDPGAEAKSRGKYIS
jgi:hypothetical protein